ncbi:DNA-binding MarR family transcriptional regulator [Rhodopseudomonas julia]|uniref:DNA-binding MarR family transcriptional regulator n=1 Tax=Rhodopseudomonas julia TaxID=200617 RepID=A0ABU0C2M0_9BRAD|nr:MarR family transcriptional regulator [Rhodopseudomonas julia]MDQ0324467.1 DNA-binding MarR family transcriptional regulator [Rhodopseudomonas julia]
MEHKTSLGFLITDAARLLRRRFEQSSRQFGMTAAQLHILGRLSKIEGINQAGLAALLDMEPITVCRHVDRMETAGLIERRPDPNDRRVRTLHITDKGRELLPDMRNLANEIFEEAQNGLSEGTRATLLTALEQIVSNLSERPGEEAEPQRQHVEA